MIYNFSHDNKLKMSHLSLSFEFDYNGDCWSDSHSHAVRIWSEALEKPENEYPGPTSFIASEYADLDQRVSDLLEEGRTVIVIDANGKETVIEPIKKKEHLKELPEAEIKTDSDSDSECLINKSDRLVDL
jgi:hypothetical protein